MSTRCKAKSKRSGERCKRYTNSNNGCCRIHGGAPGSGGDGRPPEHFLYRRHLRDEAAREAYEYHKRNPDILSLNADIALARANLGSFLETMTGPVKGDARDLIMRHLDNISKLIEREAKRLYNDKVVCELIAKQVQAQAAILQRVLSKYCDPNTAERAANEFADLVENECGISASVSINS